MDKKTLLVDGIAEINVVKKNKSWTFPVLRADTPNGNNRIYPASILKSIIESFNSRGMYYSLDPKTMIGQLGNSADGKICLSQASHIVDNLFVEDDLLYAEISPLNTPCGAVLKSMLDNNVKVCFRTQGIGEVSVREDDIFVVQNSYKLVTINALSSDKAVSLN